MNPVAPSLVGLSESNLIGIAADVNQRVSALTAGTNEEAAAVVDLRRDGAKHDFQPATYALPHGDAPARTSGNGTACRTCDAPQSNDLSRVIRCGTCVYRYDGQPPTRYRAMLAAAVAPTEEKKWADSSQP